MLLVETMGELIKLIVALVTGAEVILSERTDGVKLGTFGYFSALTALVQLFSVGGSYTVFFGE